VLLKETPLRTLKLYEYPGFKSYGVLCTIIDFSLSSAEYDGKRLFRNLHEDLWLFQDTDASSQFGVYPAMKEIIEDDWSKECLKTNVLWIAYIARELLSRITTKTSRERLQSLCERLEHYHAVVDIVRNDPFFVTLN
jgi:hypothetical protein